MLALVLVLVLVLVFGHVFDVDTMRSKAAFPPNFGEDETMLAEPTPARRR